MLVSHYALCRAEKIYSKDGTVVNAQITLRNKDTIWIKHGAGSVGIDVKNVAKVENDDGTIAQCDVAYANSRMQELIKEKNYSEAQKLCTVLLDMAPDNSKARYLHGVLNHEMGNAGEAIKDYEFLVHRQAADERVLNNLGALYAQQKKYAEAEAMFSQVVLAMPGRAEFHNNLAESLMGLGEVDRAVSEYIKVIELEPDNATALYNLGVAYKSKGQLAKAREQWQRALSINPQDADAKNALEYLQKHKL